MTRVLVTGGAGFIGRHLCHLLVARGWEVRVLDDLSTGDAGALPPAAQLIQGDICDPAALARATQDVDGIFHLAAVSSVEACSRDRAGTGRINRGGTEAIIAHAGPRPIVYTSSAAVYGDQPVLPVDEGLSPAPISPYAEDKLASEAALAQAPAPAVILRPFNVFGPGQNAASPYSGVISRFVERARSGAPLMINGDGLQTRDFVHVSDVARALALAMEHALTERPECLALNICRGDAITVLDLARCIARLAGSNAPPSHGAVRAGDIRHSCGDPRRADEVLGFRSEVSIEAGLATLFQPCPVTG